MPIYEYRCRRCRRYFDKHKDVEKRDEPEECPRCGGEAVRMFTPLGTVFKGALGE